MTTPARHGQQAGRIGFLLTGAVTGVAWASSLRAFMAALAGPASVFTFGGTFGVIIPAGLLVGALLGLAQYERGAGRQHPVLICSPLLLAIIPSLATASLDSGPAGLAVLGMIGGYSVSGRGPLGGRIAAGLVALASVIVTYLAPKPVPELSVTTAHGAWFATLASSLFVTFALACSIPMRRPQPGRAAGPALAGQAPVSEGSAARQPGGDRP